MKKLHYILLGIIFASMFACSEADKEMFKGPDSICFRFPQTSDDIDEYRKLDSSLIFREDTVVYSFAFDMEATERVICIPVQIGGMATGHERTYMIEGEEYNGTQAGVHYEALRKEQVLGAEKTTDSLRVKFFRRDMDKVARKIGLRIKTGGDFVEGAQERLFLAIQVSDILEKPSWWDNWSDCFGTFHPIKYREWIKIYGGTGDLTGKRPDWWVAPLELTLILELKELFEREEFYDENNVRLTIPCTH
ncbi:DUF4843 domain-containing protein [Butyricimonas virosa]